MDIYISDKIIQNTIKNIKSIYPDLLKLYYNDIFTTKLSLESVGIIIFIIDSLEKFDDEQELYTITVTTMSGTVFIFNINKETTFNDLAIMVNEQFSADKGLVFLNDTTVYNIKFINTLVIKTLMV